MQEFSGEICASIKKQQVLIQVKWSLGVQIHLPKKMFKSVAYTYLKKKPCFKVKTSASLKVMSRIMVSFTLDLF